MRDCETDYQLDYTLQLVTNMTTELQTQLDMETDVQVSNALKAFLGKVFVDYAHDVDLSFYDVQGDSLRLHHETHVMDASQSSYTLYIPVREYMHLALANVEGNPGLSLVQDERCHTAQLTQAVQDTVDSHRTGIFTARLPMDIKEGKDQQFNVSLFMANCACTLVLDTLGSHVRDVKVYTSGFATGFNLADSTYRYSYTPIVRTEKVPVSDDPSKRLCFASVVFPSKETADSKVVINTDDPFASELSEKALWYYRIYTVLEDGSTTETLMGMCLPLRPGQVKVVQGKVMDDGSTAPKDETITVSVVLKWSPGMSWEITF